MRFFLALSGLILALQASAQIDVESQKVIERRIEFIGENLEDSDLDLTVFLEDFYLFLENPLNLNEADFEMLGRLHLLSDVQMISILNYRKKYGHFITVYELAAIPELDREVIDMMLPFITVAPVVTDNFKWKYAFKYGNHEVLTRYERVLEEKAGYMEYPDSVLIENPNKQYLGSPDKFYIRYRNQYKDRVSWGATAEKDAGEEFFRGTLPWEKHRMFLAEGAIRRYFVHTPLSMKVCFCVVVLLQWEQANFNSPDLHRTNQ
jgi:hypothetical protein